MSGGGAAKRRAREAAEASEQARSELDRQAEEMKRIREREKVRSQRLLMRSLRAAGGGFFETDKDTLGGSGALG